MDTAKPDYEYTMGSDLHRDGMFLELTRVDRPNDILAEVFYSDVDGSMTFSGYARDLPLDIVEWLIAEGHRRLPSISSSSDEEPSSPPPS